jgi:LacI family fructose operon transcriptional repressor
MARLGLTASARFLAPSVAAAEAEICGWFDRGEAPEAVIASNGLLLLGVVRGMRAAGRSMPGDMAVAGFDNETWTELVGPGLTVIEQPVAEMGRAAMDLLLERLETPGGAVRKIVLGGICVMRGSTVRS